jgi:hypothetical protein
MLCDFTQMQYTYNLHSDPKGGIISKAPCDFVSAEERIYIHQCVSTTLFTRIFKLLSGLDSGKGRKTKITLIITSEHEMARQVRKLQ